MFENRGNEGYTVPQHVRTERVDRFVEVSFRVRRVFGDSVIEVSSGGKVISAFRRGHMAPGEMEHIVVPKKLLQNAADGKITVSAKEAE